MSKINEEARNKLISAAWDARENAYVPYSHFKVGAAVLGVDGNIYKGCNIENVSYGLTNCAERTAIFKMVSEGCQKFVGIAIVATEDPGPSGPCGACRQVLCEFCEDVNTTEIISAGRNGEVIIESVLDLCPRPFMQFKAND